MVVPGRIKHDGVQRDLPSAGDGVLLGPSGFNGVGYELGWEHDMKALVLARVEMSELSVDEERVCGTVDGLGQAECSCPRDGDQTGALLDSW